MKDEEKSGGNNVREKRDDDVEMSHEATIEEWEIKKDGDTLMEDEELLYNRIHDLVLRRFHSDNLKRNKDRRKDKKCSEIEKKEIRNFNSDDENPLNQHIDSPPLLLRSNSQISSTESSSLSPRFRQKRKRANND